MCKKQLKILENKDCISVKTVLLKNTIKVIEKHKDFGNRPGDFKDDGDDNSSYLESLLNEIDLEQCRIETGISSPPLSTSTLDEEMETEAIKKNHRISDVLEEFHNCKTFSPNGLIFKEDPDIFLEMSQDEYETSDRGF